MSELKIKESSNWEVVESTDGYTKLRMVTHTYAIDAEMRIMPFSGDIFEMREFLQKSLQQDGVIDTLNVSFIHRNLKWHLSSFVCKEGDRFRYFYYTFFDQQCVLICLFTDSERAVLRFREEVTQLLDTINYDNLRVDNIFFLGDKEYFVKTPLSYKFSFTSTREHLLFLGRGSYIVVNVDAPEDLTQMVDENVYLAGLCIDGCKVRCAERSQEGDIVSYQILWEYLNEEKVVGICTYVRSKLSDGASVVSFIYQSGEAMGESIDNLFCFRVGGD